MRKLIKLTMQIVFISLTSCSTYQLTSKDFIKQFDNNCTDDLTRVYCTNEKGEKVWLSTHNEPRLLIKEQNSDKIIDYNIKRTKYSTDSVIAIRLNAKASKKIIPIKNISTFQIKAIFPVEYKYFNVDSLKRIAEFKNDSLGLECERDLNKAIFLEKQTSDVPIKDSIFLFVGGCYNMTFKDKLEVNQSVIQNITNDSIYISNAFSKNVAKSYKNQYKIHGYLIDEIDFISALYRDGKLSFKLSSKDYKFKTIRINRKKFDCPCWYKLEEDTGEISFYRNWLSYDGYIGIKEKNGKIYW
jgi:hypothetical protein